MGKQIERIVNAERVEDLIAVFGSFGFFHGSRAVEESVWLNNKYGGGNVAFYPSCRLNN